VTSGSCSCSWLGGGFEGGTVGRRLWTTAAPRCRRRPGCAPGGRVQVAPRIAAPASGEHRRPPTVSGRVMDRRPAPVSRRAGRGRIRPAALDARSAPHRLDTDPAARCPGRPPRHGRPARTAAILAAAVAVARAFATATAMPPILRPVSPYGQARMRVFAGRVSARIRAAFPAAAAALPDVRRGRGGLREKGTGAGPGGGWDAGWLPGPGAGGGDRPGGGPPWWPVLWFGGRAVPGACRAGCVA
jgi:translation initiation factor IF-2